MDAANKKSPLRMTRSAEDSSMGFPMRAISVYHGGRNYARGCVDGGAD